MLANRDLIVPPFVSWDRILHGPVSNTLVSLVIVEQNRLSRSENIKTMSVHSNRVENFLAVKKEVEVRIEGNFVVQPTIAEKITTGRVRLHSRLDLPRHPAAVHADVAHSYVVAVAHDDDVAVRLVRLAVLVPAVGVVGDDGAARASPVQLRDRLEIPVENEHVVRVHHHVVAFAAIEQHGDVAAEAGALAAAGDDVTSADVVERAEVGVVVAFVEFVGDAGRIARLVLLDDADEEAAGICCFGEHVADGERTFNVAEGCDGDENCEVVLVHPGFADGLLMSGDAAKFDSLVRRIAEWG